MTHKELLAFFASGAQGAIPYLNSLHAPSFDKGGIATQILCLDTQALVILGYIKSNQDQVEEAISGFLSSGN